MLIVTVLAIATAALPAAVPEAGGLVVHGSPQDRSDLMAKIEATRARSPVFDHAWRELEAHPEPVHLAVGRDLAVTGGPTAGFVQIDAFEYGLYEGQARRARGWQVLDLDDLDALPERPSAGQPQAQDQGASLVHAVVELLEGIRHDRSRSAERYDHAHRAALRAENAYRIEQGQATQASTRVHRERDSTRWVVRYRDGSTETLTWREGRLVHVGFGG